MSVFLEYDELSTSDENISRSDDSTPQNSPKAARSLLSPDSSQVARMQPPSQQQQQESSHSTQTLKSQRSALSTMQPSAMMSSNNSNNIYGKEILQMPHMSNSSTLGKEPARKVYIETRKCPNLGISLLGGNAYGIFIHSVHKDSIAENVGLRVGDQILEYNGKDLRRATAEYAAFELAKPADKVMAVVQYNIQSECFVGLSARNGLNNNFLIYSDRTCRFSSHITMKDSEKALKYFP